MVSSFSTSTTIFFHVGSTPRMDSAMPEITFPMILCEKLLSGMGFSSTRSIAFRCLHLPPILIYLLRCRTELPRDHYRRRD